MTKTVLTINGMMCGHCVAAVKKALFKLGVTNADIDLETKKAVIEAEDNITKESMIKAIEDLGYECE